ncbi:MAG: hypothetical protein LBD61_05045 [Endomicrobium sp.]|nr:hypothetical protein [Endomicrobium sp.]
MLVDEYDKPLIDNLSKEEVYPEVKRTFFVWVAYSPFNVELVHS